MKFRAFVNWVLTNYATLERLLGTISAGIIVLLMALTVIDVFLRYVFNNPIQGSYQVAQFLMVGIVFLGIAYVQSIKGHVKVAFLTSRIPPRGRDALNIFAYSIGLVIYAVVTWRGALFAWDSWQVHDYTMGLVHYPLWPAKSMIPLGSGMLCIRLILDIVHDSAKLVGHQHQT